MEYKNLRNFIVILEQQSKLKRIAHPVSPHLEMTEIADRVLCAEGSMLLFESPIKPDGTHYDYPVLANLFDTPEHVAMDIGADSVSKLREIGQTLAYLREPEPPKGTKDALSKSSPSGDTWSMALNMVKNTSYQEIVRESEDADLYRLPIQHCQPEDVAPLITWGSTVMRGPYKKRRNLGIYRQQLIDKNRLIIHWPSHRGGALDYQGFRKLNPGAPYPVTVVLSCDPTTISDAVTPAPDTLNEHQFAGLLRGSQTELAKCIGNDLQVPARTEIVLEGMIHPNETALEDPYGDYTGYYNEWDHFPVFTIEHIVMRENPTYHSIYMGKPPDEPAVLGVASNGVFVSLLQKQFPEITDFYLPPEGCPYRMMVVSMKKQYAEHAKRVMTDCQSFPHQFMYARSIIAVGDGVNVHDWKEIIWAVTTRMDPVRDTVLVENTPIGYPDFANLVSGLDGKVGLDAANKWPGETDRE